MNQTHKQKETCQWLILQSCPPREIQLFTYNNHIVIFIRCLYIHTEMQFGTDERTCIINMNYYLLVSEYLWENKTYFLLKNLPFGIFTKHMIYYHNQNCSEL